MSNQIQYTLDGLPKARQSTSLALPTASCAQADDELDSFNSSKPILQPRRENTGDRTGCISALTVIAQTHMMCAWAIILTLLGFRCFLCRLMISVPAPTN